MRQNGLEAKILRYASEGGIVFGICGGYQMLGAEISDPEGVEQKGTVRGMELLPVRTRFTLEKRRTRIQGHFLELRGILKDLSGMEFEGYEIHMGESSPLQGEDPVGSSHAGSLVEFTDITEAENISGAGRLRPDGAQRGNVYGCYVHGIFDAPGCAEGFISALLKRKGYDPSQIQARDWKAYKEEQYDRLADIIRESLDMERIYQIIEKLDIISINRIGLYKNNAITATLICLFYDTFSISKSSRFNNLFIYSYIKLSSKLLNTIYISIATTTLSSK